jgi:hypothetical protein
MGWFFLFAVWLVAGSAPASGSPSGDAGVFELVRGANAAPVVEGEADCSFDHESTGSKWTEGVDESKVFLATLKAGDLSLGIGKGGQIFSIRGPFGEAVPPQRKAAPWIDEVWHLVVTNEDLVTPIHHFQNEDPPANWQPAMPLQYFIHQAGIYLEGLTGPASLGPATEPFYSPLLESRWDEETGTLFLANWAQQARAPNVWKSGALVLSAYRSLGGGAFEVTQSLTNFGAEDLTYLNAPWGGVRHSTLPQTVLSKPDGSWSKVGGVWGWAKIPMEKFSDTGGWIAWTSPECAEGDPALALVFGREAEGSRPWKRAAFRILHGTADDIATRDYNVVEASCSVRIQPGETLVVRWYLLAGSFAEVRQRAADLVPHADMWMPESDAPGRVPVWLAEGGPMKTGEGAPAFHLHALPGKGRVPVFLLEDTRSGEVFATTDPYELVRSAPLENPLPADHPRHALYEGREVFYPYEGPGRLVGLLGFARPEADPDGKDAMVALPGADGTELNLWIPREFVP